MLPKTHLQAFLIYNCDSERPGMHPKALTRGQELEFQLLKTALEDNLSATCMQFFNKPNF